MPRAITSLELLAAQILMEQCITMLPVEDMQTLKRHQVSELKFSDQRLVLTGQRRLVKFTNALILR